MSFWGYDLSRNKWAARRPQHSGHCTPERHRNTKQKSNFIETKGRGKHQKKEEVTNERNAFNISGSRSFARSKKGEDFKQSQNVKILKTITRSRNVIVVIHKEREREYIGGHRRYIDPRWTDNRQCHSFMFIDRRWTDKKSVGTKQDAERERICEVDSRQSVGWKEGAKR